MVYFPTDSVMKLVAARPKERQSCFSVIVRSDRSGRCGIFVFHFKCFSDTYLDTSVLLMHIIN